MKSLNQIQKQYSIQTSHMQDGGTQKIQNEHADQQISVSGSEIESNSEGNQDYQQRKDVMKGQKLGGINYDDNKPQVFQGGYKASDYAGLPVSSDVKELFKIITRYQPITMDIDTKVKAFVPDFTPAVGEVDAFLKMPRPDGQPQILGLNMLDQPCLNQSDTAKIALEIKNKNKQYSGGKYSKVHAIENAEKNPKQVVQWVNSVGDIQKNKQPPSVSYSKQMPDIDSLMQVWPAEVEEILSDLAIPGEQIDLSLEDYCKVACNILDIPVHREGGASVVQAMHVMFTLFSAFKENQHFQMNQQNESYVDRA